MFIVHSDSVFQLPPGTSPDYNSANPLMRLLDLVARSQLAAERQMYLQPSLQYLFPYDQLELYGPQGSDAGVLDPARQDNKTDFQKQNVKTFLASDTYLVRGWVSVSGWTGPFLKLSYRGGPDSTLSQAANGQLGPAIRLFVKVRDIDSGGWITVPYNDTTHRYEIELWGYPGSDLPALLQDKGRDSLARGELVARPDMIHGQFSDFSRDGLDNQLLTQVHPENAMHPILPLHVETAWSDVTGTHYDSQNGANHQFEFNMIVRGWDSFLSVGVSPNPHGGLGILHYRNLLSNYGRYAGLNELGRQIEPWMFDAFGHKVDAVRQENFFAVDYMDLHILMNNCGIGLHRHRDNQEVFFMVEGQGLMVVGDWCKMPQRERCFEIRTLRSGHFAMLKGGNLHALFNSTDVDIFLFMFGGYD